MVKFKYHKMKIFVIMIIFLLIGFESFSQDTISIKLSDLKGNMDFSLEKRRNLFISNLADSLNNYKEGKLPFFLSIYDFDYLNSSFWDSNHQPNCIRKMILEKVYNQKSLYAILKSKNKNYKKTSKLLLQYFTPTKIPYQDISNWHLAKEQLKKLHNK